MTAPAHERTSVVVITPEYAGERIGGLGTYAEMLVDYLRRRFSRLYVVEIPYANQSEYAVRQGRHGEHIVRLPFPRFHTRTILDPSFLERLYGELPMDEPLLVIGNEAYGAYVGDQIRAAAGLARLVYVPHLYASEWLLHGYRGERFVELVKAAPPGVRSIIVKEMEMLGRADFVLFISDYMRAYAGDSMGTEPARHAVIEHYIPPPPAVKTHYASEIRDVIFTGRLEIQKGLHDVFEHLEEVLQCLPRATLHIHAQGMLRSVLEWRSRRHGARVVWHGLTPREELLRILPDMDLALVPSLYEPFGYTALEAMAAGVPLVASDAGGLGDLTAWLPEGLRMRTATGDNPLFGKPGTPGKHIPGAEVLRCLAHAAAHPEELAAVGRQGAARARERYGEARYAQEMDAFLDEVLQSLDPGAPAQRP